MNELWKLESLVMVTQWRKKKMQRENKRMWPHAEGKMEGERKLDFLSSGTLVMC